MGHLYRKLIIEAITEETPSAKTFILKTAKNEELEYLPGQFLTLAFPHELKGEDRRSYSFSSSPLTDGAPAITVKKIANGEYSRRLMNAKPGDQLYLAGVSGFFVLPDHIQSYEQLFFFAAGSGITPIFSLIKTVLSQYSGIAVVLIYSNRNRKDTIFYEELNKLAVRFPGRFQIHFLFSESADILKARLGNYLLLELLSKYVVSSWEKTYFFICGPFDYMDTVMITLLTEGVPKDHIRKENFNSNKPEIKVEPPDTQPHKVTIFKDKKAYELKVQYPNSILTEALKHDIPLPYSCRSGQCGSCTATCLDGKVWMSYNEVLTHKELKNGMILTCMGFPVGGDVTITF